MLETLGKVYLIDAETRQRKLSQESRLPAPDRDVLIARLDRVRLISHNFGYGVGDDMDSLLARHLAT